MLGVNLLAILGQRESCVAYLDLKDGFKNSSMVKSALVCARRACQQEYGESLYPNAFCENLKTTSAQQGLPRFEMV